MGCHGDKCVCQCIAVSQIAYLIKGSFSSSLSSSLKQQQQQNRAQNLLKAAPISDREREGSRSVEDSVRAVRIPDKVWCPEMVQLFKQERVYGTVSQVLSRYRTGKKEKMSSPTSEVGPTHYIHLFLSTSSLLRIGDPVV